jgi:predicted aldo/keto reductase-like oxidoreductase
LGGGISQKGVGEYFNQYPNDRKKIFLMTKTDDREPEDLTKFLNKEVPIGDVMRYLMYAKGYGDKMRAEALFGKLPRQTRADIIGLDYSQAEKKCPQKIAIGKIMRSTAKELAC